MPLGYFRNKEFGAAPEAEAPITSRTELQNIIGEPARIVPDSLIQVPRSAEKMEGQGFQGLENTFAKPNVAEMRFGGIANPLVMGKQGSGERQRGTTDYMKLGYTPSKFAFPQEYAKGFAEENGFKVKKQVKEKNEGELKPPMKKKDKKENAIAEKGGYKVKKEKEVGKLKPPMKKENMLGHHDVGPSWAKRFDS